MLQPKLDALTSGTSGLAVGYACVAVPMVLGLLMGRAPLSRVLLAPLLAVPAMLLAGITVALVSPALNSFGLATHSPLRVGVGALICGVTGYVSGRLAARRSSFAPEHRRGARVLGPDLAMPRHVRRVDPNAARSNDTDGAITIAGIPIAAQDETKHFKLVGTTGTGKSTAIREMLNLALARGDRAVIADPDGGYLRDFFDAGRADLILNPFDSRSVKWSVLGEVENDYDVDQLARSMIPDTGDPDRIWSEYARTFFTAVVQRARVAQVTDDRELDRLLTDASPQELRRLLAGTSAAPFLENGNEKMFGSVRAVMSSAIRALKYITQQRASPFSVRQWVRQGAARYRGGRGGVLFLPYRAGEIAALRSMISAWVRIAIFEAMSRDEEDQRLWFVVDELDALGEIDGLKDALARLRKFGGRAVVGFQSIAQVSGTYGKPAADTIVENCGNTLILRCSASERGGTSEFASKLIGQREVVHTSLSRSRRAMEWFGSTTRSEQLRIEPAVLASEIERLPDLEGYLKLASNPDWRRVRLEPVSYPKPRPEWATRHGS